MPRGSKEFLTEFYSDNPIILVTKMGVDQLGLRAIIGDEPVACGLYLPHAPIVRIEMERPRDRRWLKAVFADPKFKALHSACFGYFLKQDAAAWSGSLTGLIDGHEIFTRIDCWADINFQRRDQYSISSREIREYEVHQATWRAWTLQEKLRSTLLGRLGVQEPMSRPLLETLVGIVVKEAPNL